MIHLATLATEAARKSEILGLDGNTLSVDGGQVGVLEERDEVRLGRLLEGHHRRGLEAQVGLFKVGDASVSFHGRQRGRNL